eukprot:CAMPEP_0170550348 /NCGR_PEP_ID=MMETSP0211-20121228/8409_1 /TAXON_ID=311385 /ORGANISM="Pseudokeronopsis sp., Strain OXSARD2" /LENGTH=129 /DNA_ID=CAMNT_0010856847 /DNA_START=566 /DNA_END=951 /DNA_ORIENTATION=+
MLFLSQSIKIGITTDLLLRKKAYAEFLESFQVRKDRVEEFLKRLCPNIRIEFFELSDPVGIGGTDTEIEACILTREVEKGGLMINEARAKNSLPDLSLIFVDMILAHKEEDNQTHYSNKTSSSYIRKYL